MSLIALQRDFHAHLVDASSGLKARISARASSGLSIYRNAYRAQLTDCLGETFVQTRAWLGGETFIDAARSHVQRMPPSSWTLGAYGDGFDGTLSELYPDDPEVAELARIEWMLSKAFEAEDADALPASVISGIDWDNAVIVFVPTLRTIPALTNAGAILSELAEGGSPPAAASLPEPASMLIWRHNFTPCFRSIEAVERQAIELTDAGASFADLCATLVGMRGKEDGLALAGQMLGQWFADGLVHKVHMRFNPCA